MITRELRQSVRAALAAAGLPAERSAGADPGLRPAGAPGRYAVSAALALGPQPRVLAATLAGYLARGPGIAAVEVTGPGYLTITVTEQALAAVADQVTVAGPACAASDALAGVTVPAPPPGDPLAAARWEQARVQLAAALTARLAAAAGATVTRNRPAERERVPPAPSHDRGSGEGQRRSDSGEETTDVAAAVAFAGRDAVTFTLARAGPGRPLRPDPALIARHEPANPAYAVRYAHARAASGVRWAATAPAAVTLGAGALGGGTLSREAAALLDALSWLPERVATAARRGRPDEFARYLEDLAQVTVDCLSSGYRGSDRLALASAARTGLAAGLGLLGVSAPDRLLADI